MTVASVMTEAVVSDAPDDSIAEAAAKMREQQTGSLVILEGGRLAGIFTERDLLKAIARGLDPKETQVREVMTEEVVTISPEALLRDAASIMASKWIRHLPVVEGTRVVGMLSSRDLIGVLAQTLDDPESFEQVTDSELTRAKRLERIEAGDLD